jgi:predicted amidophosphoribosyltransferase
MAVGAVGDFRTVQLARKVARGVKGVVEVSEAIRWDAPREKAHLKGGARHYSQYEPHMVLTATPAHDVVLFDDVITSGSQMIAAARFLRARGINVRRGVTFARAVQAQYDEQALLKREGSLDLDPGQFDLDF